MSDPAKSVSPADEGCVDIWQYGGSQSRHLVVFIPGNPGILEYYTEYLHLLHQHLADAQIVACSLDYRDMRTLDQQIGFKIHTVRRLVRARGRSRDGKAIVIGHSVGSYIACRVHEAEPLLVDTVVGLFPTVSHIAKSRAGMLMTPLLRIPALPALVGLVVTVMRYAIPHSWLLRLVCMRMPMPGARVTVDRLLTGPAVRSVLYLAATEMMDIKGPSEPYWRVHAHNVYLIYGVDDHWVPDWAVEELKSLCPAALHVHVVPAHIKHSFCLRDSEDVARITDAMLARIL